MKDSTDTPIDGETDVVAQLIHRAGRREQPPVEAYQRTLEVATTAWETKIRGRRRQRRNASLIAACLVSAVAAVAVFVTLSPWPFSTSAGRIERLIGAVEWRAKESMIDESRWIVLHDEGQPLPSGSSLRTRAGSRAGLMLDGGVSLRLAEDTHVVLQSASSIRLLTGKLYVDTGAHEDGHRIEVITAAGTARDVGTQFEVRYRDNLYRLRVREGEVLLRHGPEDVHSGAGEQLIVDAEGELHRAAVASDDPQWDWVESIAPAPDIDGRPLKILLDWVARETARALRYATPEIEQRANSTILHGNVRHLEPLEALSVMLATTDLEHQLLDDGAILIRSKAAP